MLPRWPHRRAVSVRRRPPHPRFSAEKTFQSADLDDAAIKLEADLKDEAGTVEKPVITLKKDADDALRSGDLDSAADIYTQIVSVAPNDVQAWRRLGDLWLKMPTSDEDDGSERFQNATTAAYIAYRRATSPTDEANALILLASTYGKRNDWRPALNALALALKLNETLELKTTYDQLRAKYGFRVSNYSVDSDAASPRACFQFTESLPKRTDFSPYVAVAGMDKPALSVDDQQLCVEGLQHGESYGITLREGLPSTVGEDLLKTADFNIYVRDRSPFVRLAGKAYVLPKTGQQGIPLVSVNTDKIKVTIYRIGDRNLIDSVLGGDFERNLYGYSLNDIAEQKGNQVWTGEMTVDKAPLNDEVTTDFPVTEAVPELAPGIYVLAAVPGSVPPEEYSERATQWFIVSDLGLTAYSGSDGVHAFVNSLATTKPVGGVELRLIARNNEVLATKTTDDTGSVAFAPGLSRGEGGLSPALLVASTAAGEYAFLSLKGSPFDLTDRGVGGRDAPQGLDAYVFTERGVYRTGETVHVTTLLRDANSVAVEDVPLTLVVTRSDGVEYRRSVVPDQGIGGRVARCRYRLGGADRDLARRRLHRSQAACHRRGDLPRRGLRPGSARVRSLHHSHQPLAADAGGDQRRRPLPLRRAGGGARPRRRDPHRAGDRASGLCRLPVRLRRGERRGREAPTSSRSPICPRPTRRQGELRGGAHQSAGFDAAARRHDGGAHGGARRTRGRAQPHPAHHAAASHDRGEAALHRQVARRLRHGELRRGHGGARRQAGREAGLHWQLLRIDSKYQWYRSDGYWQYEPIKVTQRVADGSIDVAADKPGRISVPVTWGRYRLEVTSGDPQGPETTVGFDSGWYAEASADTPDLLEIALDKPEYRPGDSMTVAVTARTAGEVTLAVIGDKLLATTTAHVEAGTAKLPLTVGDDWGTGAYVLATLRRPLDAEAKRMPGRAIGGAMVLHRQGRAHGRRRSRPAGPHQAARPRSRVPVKLAGLAPGEEARVVVSAVDVGILNLTNYKPPAPEDYYLGQRKLSAEVRDLYGQLIDGMQGTRGQIRSGGDSGAGELQGSPPTPAAARALFRHRHRRPRRHRRGRVRHPGLRRHGAGDGGGVDRGQGRPCLGRRDRARSRGADRDPAALPAPWRQEHDQARPRQCRRRDRHLPGRARRGRSLHPRRNAKDRFALDASKRGAVTFPVTASGIGQGTVTVSVAGPGDFSLERHFPLTVNPATEILARRTVKPLAPGESLDLVERRVRRPRRRHRHAGAVGRRRPRRSTSRACCRRSTAIRSAAPSRS